MVFMFKSNGEALEREVRVTRESDIDVDKADAGDDKG